MIVRTYTYFQIKHYRKKRIEKESADNACTYLENRK